MHTFINRASTSVPTRRAVMATTALAAAAGLLLASGAEAGTLGGTPTASEAPAKKAAVPIKDNKYLPATMTIKLGETVTWTNLDTDPHTVTTTKAPAAFDSGVFKQNQAFTHTFTTPGTYAYYCAVHPEMIAEVIVLDKNGKQVEAEKPAEPAANPIASLLGPLLPHSPQHLADKANPDNDPMAEHSAAAPGDHGTASPGAYPYQPAADPVSGAVDPFVAHVQAAHLNRGAGGNVQDAVEFDAWAKSHMVLFRQMLEYEVGKDSTFATTPVVDAFAKHMDATHWNASPMEQASAIADFDSWNLSHLAMFRQMFDPFVGTQSALGTSPVTGVFLKHMDAAHWNTSVNGQVSAATDDSASWIASHQALFQAMFGSAEAAAAGEAEPGHGGGHGAKK